MASTNTAKKMDFKQVKFDITEITPDAPAGEWEMVIPRGKCKVQPTKEEKLPMVVVPVRLEKTSEDEEKFQKALGTELTMFLVFGGKNARAERMSKLRIRQLCELLDVDLGEIPTEISGPDDLEGFIKAIEGKKFTAWTKLQIRRDTGEETTELVLVDPNRLTGGGDSDDDDDDDDKPAKGNGKAAAKKPAARKR